MNTGEALVSLDARPEQGEGIVTGDVVNTAARIQTSAPVNGVAVGEGTYRATKRVFEWEELEPIDAKGKSAPVAVRRPLRPVARFGSDVIRTHTTPFVGREVERSLLGGLLDRAIRDRTVQLVTVVGEPGVGKSRQVAELLADVDRRAELVRWRQGRCLPYGDGIAFWALGEIVKAHAGIFESDTPEVTRRQARAVLPDGDEGAWLRSACCRSSASRRRRASSAPSRSPRGGRSSSRSPSGIRRCSSSRTCTGRISRCSTSSSTSSSTPPGVPLFVLATARPELADRAPGWAGGLRNATTITLNPLSETETARLVSGLLEQTLLPADLQRAIIDRAGGNPLYAEEVVRLLRDRGLLDDRAALADVPLPETVQALIASRLDTLSPERKGLLQDASVLGKVFWSGAVAAIGGTTGAAGRRSACTSSSGASSSGRRARRRSRASGSSRSGTRSFGTSPTGRSRGRSVRRSTWPPRTGSRREPAAGSRTSRIFSRTTSARRSRSTTPSGSRPEPMPSGHA